MKLTIHRGANEIGGSCVEIQSSNNRIVIDIGMPIVTPYGSKTLPDIKGFYKHDDKHRLMDGLLISHAHLDHYGLYNFASEDIQYYLGEATHKLINLSNIFIEDRGIISKVEYIRDRKHFLIGNFKITPFLMDHSAYDAYAFLIEADGKKVFYSGDFRAHGRKGKLFYKFLRTVPEGINALLLEGTSINDGSLNTEFKKEEVVEREIAGILEKHNTIAFGIASSQNIDRMVTFYKAAKRTDRMFVVDVYTANVLTAIGYPTIPHPSKNYPEIRVFFPRYLCDKLEKGHQKDMMYKFVPYKITKDEISSNLSRVFMLVKSSMSEYLKEIKNLDASPVIYSMWKGYQEDPSMKYFIRGLTKGDDSLLYNAHTSGHADVSTLKRLVSRLRPDKVIPIHTFRPEMYKELFNNVVEIADGQEIEI
jgi:ribonuclease J